MMTLHRSGFAGINFRVSGERSRLFAIYA
jgi:hypothetical protein